MSSLSHCFLFFSLLPISNLIADTRLVCALYPKHKSLFGYIEERIDNNLPVDGERINGFVCLVQSLLLGSFAIILAAHRSEILDQKISGNGGVSTIPYEAPPTLGVTV